MYLLLEIEIVKDNFSFCIWCNTKIICNTDTWFSKFLKPFSFTCHYFQDLLIVVRPIFIQLIVMDVCDTATNLL